MSTHYVYTIWNQTSGEWLGEYEGESPIDAIDSLAVEAGYKDIDDMAEVLGVSVKSLIDDLAVEMLAPT